MRYATRGTTDDVTTCQICGKPELRGTVILAILDADGNTEDVTYAGTSCAAKLASGRTGRSVTAAQIKRDADGANYRRQRAVADAVEKLGWWEPIEFDRRAILDQYFTANPSARTKVNAIERVAEILRDARECIATDGLSAITATN